MLHVCNCNVQMRVTDEEVIQSLVDSEIITKEDAENYTPTKDQIREYAWKRIEDDEGKYGDVIVD